MTAIHIEFLYSPKVMRMRHRRAGCKQLGGGGSSRTKPHRGKVEVVAGAAREKEERRRKQRGMGWKRFCGLILKDKAENREMERPDWDVEVS